MLESNTKLYYSMKEVSEMTKLKPYVLRYWESEFPSLKPSKNKAGNRTYKKQDIEVILDIKKLLYTKKFTIKGAVEELKNRSLIPEEDSNFSTTQISALKEIKNELKNILNILNRN
jgi:DNA-binding transcriptional MerR regulator